MQLPSPALHPGALTACANGDVCAVTAERLHVLHPDDCYEQLRDAARYKTRTVVISLADCTAHDAAQASQNGTKAAALSNRSLQPSPRFVAAAWSPLGLIDTAPYCAFLACCTSALTCQLLAPATEVFVNDGARDAPWAPLLRSATVNTITQSIAPCALAWMPRALRIRGSNVGCLALAGGRALGLLVAQWCGAAGGLRAQVLSVEAGTFTAACWLPGFGGAADKHHLATCSADGTATLYQLQLSPPDAASAGGNSDDTGGDALVSLSVTRVGIIVPPRSVPGTAMAWLPPCTSYPEGALTMSHGLALTVWIPPAHGAVAAEAPDLERDPSFRWMLHSFPGGAGVSGTVYTISNAHDMTITGLVWMADALSPHTPAKAASDGAGAGAGAVIAASVGAAAPAEALHSVCLLSISQDGSLRSWRIDALLGASVSSQSLMRLVYAGRAMKPPDAPTPARPSPLYGLATHPCAMFALILCTQARYPRISYNSSYPLLHALVQSVAVMPVASVDDVVNDAWAPVAAHGAFALPPSFSDSLSAKAALVNLMDRIMAHVFRGCLDTSSAVADAEAAGTHSLSAALHARHQPGCADIMAALVMYGKLSLSAQRQLVRTRGSLSVWEPVTHGGADQQQAGSAAASAEPAAADKRRFTDYTRLCVVPASRDAPFEMAYKPFLQPQRAGSGQQDLSWLRAPIDPQPDVAIWTLFHPCRPFTLATVEPLTLFRSVAASGCPLYAAYQVVLPAMCQMVLHRYLHLVARYTTKPDVRSPLLQLLIRALRFVLSTAVADQQAAQRTDGPGARPRGTALPVAGSRRRRKSAASDAAASTAAQGAPDPPGAAAESSLASSLSAAPTTVDPLDTSVHSIESTSYVHMGHVHPLIPHMSLPARWSWYALAVGPRIAAFAYAEHVLRALGCVLDAVGVRHGLAASVEPSTAGAVTARAEAQRDKAVSGAVAALHAKLVSAGSRSSGSAATHAAAADGAANDPPEAEVTAEKGPPAKRRKVAAGVGDASSSEGSASSSEGSASAAASTVAVQICTTVTHKVLASYTLAQAQTLLNLAAWGSIAARQLAVVTATVQEHLWLSEAIPRGGPLAVSEPLLPPLVAELLMRYAAAVQKMLAGLTTASDTGSGGAAAAAAAAVPGSSDTCPFCAAHVPLTIAGRAVDVHTPSAAQVGPPTPYAIELLPQHALSLSGTWCAHELTGSLPPLSLLQQGLRALMSPLCTQEVRCAGPAKHHVSRSARTLMVLSPRAAAEDAASFL